MDRLPFRPNPCAVVMFFGVVNVILMGLAGCGQVDRSAEFIPSPSTAESALRAAMEAWKNGEPSGAVPATKPVVHVVDSSRNGGQNLVSYEILGEIPGNAHRCFAVKVQLSDPDREERLRFIVFGIDPLWIFRQEDYDLLSHWDHPMPKTKPRDEPPKAQEPKS